MQFAKTNVIQSLLNIDGIGQTQIDSLEKFFLNKSNVKVIKELKNHVLIQNDKKIINGKFKNKTFMFTGKLSNISRSEAKEIIEKNSGKILSSVSSKLNYLIIGDKPTVKKIKYAKKLKIEILKQSEWFKMLD